jgi:protein TonB
MAQFNAQSQIPRGQQQPSGPAPTGNLMMDGGTAAPMIGGSNNQHVQFVASKPIDVSSAALQLTRRTTPDYPEIARNSHVSGVVSVAITITPQGTVADARATNGPALLRQPAVNAVRNWRFKPYMLNGHPVAVTSNVNVNFAIQ